MNLNSLKFITPARVTWVLFVIPVALATVFYSLIAADRYASVSVVSVRDMSGGVGTTSSTAIGCHAATLPLCLHTARAHSHAGIF